MKLNRFLLAVIIGYFAVQHAQGQEERRICITVDDLPAISIDKSVGRYRHITFSLLETFKIFSVPAIGFVNEGMLYVDTLHRKDREGFLSAWVDAGLELGNHTYSHVDYHSSSIGNYEEEIIKGELFTNTLFNQPRVKYFRHPFLHTGETPQKKVALEQILEKHHYVEAPVTIDNSDWIFARAYDIALTRNDDKMSQRIAREYVRYMLEKIDYYYRQANSLFGKDISQVLLIHANTINADHLGELLAELSKLGYRFTSITETLKDNAYQTENNYTGRAGISWIHRWAITQKKPREFFGTEPATPRYILEYAGIDSE